MRRINVQLVAIIIIIKEALGVKEYRVAIFYCKISVSFGKAVCTIMYIAVSLLTFLHAILIIRLA